MKAIQIIADNMSISSRLKCAFSSAGLDCESVTFHEMMKQHSASAGQFRCLIVVIDSTFAGRFGGVVEEMRAMIRNRSDKSPIYLIFENDHHSMLASWIKHARQTFEMISNQDRLLAAVREITRLESAAVPRTAFLSPMEYI